MQEKVNNIDMAFVHTGKNLPADPAFVAKLEALGYKGNENGEFVEIANPSKHYTFLHSNNDRANVMRKEAMHTAVREEVKKELAEFGVKEIYLSGDEGTEIKVVKPAAKHISILASNLEELATKKDVVVVIQEHTQDPGIWAWRLVTREAGKCSSNPTFHLEIR